MPLRPSRSHGNRYTTFERYQALTLRDALGSTTQAALTLGIGYMTLNRWVRSMPPLAIQWRCGCNPSVEYEPVLTELACSRCGRQYPGFSRTAEDNPS